MKKIGFLFARLVFGRGWWFGERFSWKREEFKKGGDGSVKKEVMAWVVDRSWASVGLPAVEVGGCLGRRVLEEEERD